MALGVSKSSMLLSAATGALSLGAAAPALSQTAPPKPTADQNSVQEVVVTAQRVQQNLQRVPLAVTAFTSETIANSHIETIADIALRTPGFTAVQINPAEPNYTIRGIGSAEGVSQNAGGDASVVVFVDGVYAGRGGTADIDAYNLERVEVLRGPQGTLFGKNAVGGLVQFVSKKPSETRSAYISATLGNYEKVDLSGRVNLPITDKLFFSGGVSSKQRNGYEYNQTTGNDVDDQHMFTVQGALRYLPTPNLDIVLAADYTNQDQRGQPRDNICNAALAGGAHCVGVNPDPRIVNAYTDGYIQRELATLRGEVNWTTPLGVFTSVTGYRNVKLHFLTPFFSNPVNPPAQIESTEIDDEDDNQFSQEVRLSFNTLQDRLRGVAGVYFLNEDNNRIEGLIQQFPAPAQTGVASYPQSVTSRSYAVFGQADYKLTDTLTLTAGARMTWEEKTGDFAGFKVSGPGLPPPLSANYAVTASQSWEAFTPRVALQWQAAPAALFYVSAARGFKSGGFQGIAGSAAGASTPYNPEYAWSYEGGAKTQWFANRLRLNLALYQTNYTDLQVSQLVPLCCVVVGNAAEARIRGFELEFLARITPQLQIDGSYTYLDAKYISFSQFASANYTGNRLTRSPRDKVNIGVQYRQPIGDWSVLGRVDYLYSGSYFFDPNNIVTQTQPSYSTIDARLALTAPGGRWTLSLWGKNLNDQLVATYVTAFAPFGQRLVPYAPPRTFGVTLSYSL